MHVKIETEAAQFLFWEYINGIFIAVQEQKVHEWNTWLNQVLNWMITAARVLHR